MTGFFGLRKDVFARGRNVSPLGFKICLELYVKCGVRVHEEVPFSFGVRVEGESKLTGKVIVHYLQQLWELYNFRYPTLVRLFLLLIVVVVILVLFYGYKWFLA
eukprot:GILI01051760.1.p1 GENE.GILI01051760.1~~GILI01051760.1.p1  ORF type:complete len:117 (-),score=17.92 GILI01051760.1:180-491(-)